MKQEAAQPQNPKAGEGANKEDLEREKIYLSRFLNEDTLINQRLTWLLASQALLFAAYGTLTTKAMDSCREKADYLLSVATTISWVGPLLAAAILIGIAAALRAQYILHIKRVPPSDQMGVSTLTTRAGWAVAVFVPCIFLGTWLFIPHPKLESSIQSCADAIAGSITQKNVSPGIAPAVSPSKTAAP